MFEDATFESAGRIRTRSRGWMFAAFAFNSSILLAMVLIPLICPEALPRQVMAFLMEAPVPLPAAVPIQQPTVQPARPANGAQYDPFAAPRKIPTTILVPSEPEPAITISTMGPVIGVPGGTGDPIFGPAIPRVMRPDVKTPLRISSKIEEGLLIRKTIPPYPAIAKAAGVGGTVILAATISKTGTIENLRVTSGPAMLQRAALDAVSTWLYRPYLLNGQPVEVETTVDVIFTLNR
jgi:protein TonB